MSRKRKVPILSDEAHEVICQIRPEIIKKYEDAGKGPLESFVRAWLHWATRKIQLRSDGEKYNSVSPWARKQARLWMAAGSPYKFNGGTEASEAEHDRAAGKAKRRRRAPKTSQMTESRRRRRINSPADA